MPSAILSPELAAVAAEFPAAGRLVAAQPFGHGHINRTFVLTAEGGARFVLQQINGRVFKRIPELMENIRRVTTHLRVRSPRGLELVPARDGTVFVRDAAGEAWRLYRFIAGAHTVEQATDPAQARETARAFGLFQAQLADLPGGRLHETIPDFHHTRRRFDAFAAAVAADPCNRAAGVRAEIAFAAAREADADRLLGLLARGEIRERITHNDTKLNNVMLDDATGRGVAVVDLDTVMPGLSLYDFGDMVRTSVAAAAEDEPDPARVEVRLPFFRALVEGYLETAGGMLNVAERAHLAFAGRLLAYEQGLRFLTDYLQGDTYYRIHRPAQNLDRTRAQFALVRGLETQEVALGRIVAEIQGSP